MITGYSFFDLPFGATPQEVRHKAREYRRIFKDYPACLMAINSIANICEGKNIADNPTYVVDSYLSCFLDIPRDILPEHLQLELRNFVPPKESDSTDIATNSSSSTVIQSDFQTAWSYIKQDPPDWKSAHTYLVQAATTGHVLANYFLGEDYYYGHSVPYNIQLAVKYYQVAADGGLAPAQGQLGYLYEKGEGVPQNYDIAVALYMQAAETDSDARIRLALCFENGTGVGQSEKIALSLLNEEAENDHPVAQLHLGRLLVWGELANYESKYKGVDWLKKASLAGHPHAHFLLALCYDGGEGIAVNKKEAVRLYTLAANDDIPGAIVNLALCYCKGEGTTQDINKAISLCRRAVALGDKEAPKILNALLDIKKGERQNTYTSAWNIFANIWNTIIVVLFIMAAIRGCSH